MTDRRERVFVTGATGYLGGRLTQHLLREGFSVRVGSRKDASSVRKMFGDCVDHVRYDLAETNQDLDRVVSGCQSVVHLAGMNAQDCGRDAQLATSTNVGGTERLVSACVRQSVSRFIFASTIHVFGAPLSGMLNETTPTRPSHPYGQSNADAEVAVLSRSSEISSTVVRLSNAFGPPHCDNEACWKLLVNDLCLQAVQSGVIKLRTTGNQKRDFVPVTVVCAGTAHLLQQPAGNVSGVFHIGSGGAISVLQVANLIAERCRMMNGMKPVIETGNATEDDSDFTFHSTRVQELGFVPNQTLESEIDLCLAHVSTRKASLNSESS